MPPFRAFQRGKSFFAGPSSEAFCYGGMDPSNRLIRYDTQGLYSTFDAVVVLDSVDLADDVAAIISDA